MDTANILIAVEEKLIAEGIYASLKRNFDGVNEIRVLNAEETNHIKDYCAESDPNLIILDLDHSELKGTDIISSLLEEAENTRILVLTNRIQHQFLERVVDAGAHGLVLKSSGMEEIHKAIENLLDGKHFYCSEATFAIVNDNEDEEVQYGENFQSDLLTERELEVLALICQELTNREIAEKLKISVRTVDAHRRNLLQKTGAKNTVGLVKYAVKIRLINI